MSKLMKLLGSMLAIVIATTACSDDDSSTGGSNGNLSVTVPLRTELKVVAGYSAKNLEKDYDLRVIVELYDKDDTSVAVGREVFYTLETSLLNTSSVTAGFNVGNGEYYALAWCDYVESDADGFYRDLVYNADNLQEITLTTDTYGNGNVENNSLRRAFAGLTEIEVSGQTSAEVAVASIVGGYSITAESSSLVGTDGYMSTIQYQDEIPAGFNVLTGEITSYASSLKYYYDISTTVDETIIGFDYLLMGYEPSTLDVSLVIYLYDETDTLSQSIDHSVTASTDF